MSQEVSNLGLGGKLGIPLVRNQIFPEAGFSNYNQCLATYPEGHFRPGQLTMG